MPQEDDPVARVWDWIWAKYEQGGYRALNPYQRLFFDVWCYEDEINNGGHDQYFFNSSGDHWKSALRGLRVLGELRAVELFEQALSVFGEDGPPTERFVRQDQLLAFKESQTRFLESLDELYYTEAIAFQGSMERYLSRHESELYS